MKDSTVFMDIKHPPYYFLCSPAEAVELFVPKEARLIVGVSGGVDSMSLISALCKRNKNASDKIIAAHINHNLRPDSIKDEELVRIWCKEHKIAFFTKRLAPAKEKVNLELWGRKERYAFFTSLLQKHKAHLILTAHTANDLAETVIMRLLSNKELKGISFFDKKRQLLRPFLFVLKKELYQYAEENKVPYREDYTNKDTSFLRNRVRLEIIPFLAKKSKNIKDIVSLLAERAWNLQNDISAMYEIAQKECQKLKNYSWGSFLWLKETKNLLSGTTVPSLKGKIVELLVKEKLGYNLGRKKAFEVEEVILGKRLAVQLEGGFELRRVKGELMLKQTT